METNMKYSILMSVYKKAISGEIEISINSILAQTVLPDQIIIVLDGPVSDDVKETLNDYDKSHTNLFTIVPLPQNHGLAYALNQGIANARNNLIARMDADDYSVPDRCEKQLKRFAEDPELAVLGTCSRHFTSDPANASKEFLHRPTTQKEIMKEMRRNNPFSHPSIMFKKDVVLACGGYDNSLVRRQDHDLFSKIVFNGYHVANLPEALVYTRKDNNFMERNRNKESCRMRMIVQKNILQRKQCSIIDYLYVWLKMSFSRIVPIGLYKMIYRFAKHTK